MAANILDLIGNTALVEIQCAQPKRGAVLAKAEFLNPGGSIKDRAALQIIKQAKERGEITDGCSVVEMTSGNMGAGLAVVCGVMGHPFIATMSSGNSPERATMLRGLGAQVVKVAQVNGSPGQVTGQDIAAAVDEAKHIAQTQGAFYVDQFNRVEGFDAHYSGIGAEIVADVPNIMGFAACVGTGATLCGAAMRLKEHNPDVVCVAVEPAGAEVLAGRPLVKPKHRIQGIGYGVIPPHWHAEMIDRYDAVTDEEALEMTARLGSQEGLYVGVSSGANVVAATRLAEELGGAVVTVLCDSGLKYSECDLAQ